MFFGEPFGGLIPGARGAVLSALLRTGTPLTGRQVHALVSDEHSVWSVQEALKTLTRLGVVETQAIGRAGIHAINEGHAAVAHLRALAEPIHSPAAGNPRGSGRPRRRVGHPLRVARAWGAEPGQRRGPGGHRRPRLGRSRRPEDAVRTSVGNGCDVLVFSANQFVQLAQSGEPVIRDILRDGHALLGSIPNTSHGAA